MFARTSYVLMGVLVVVFGLTTLASANVITIIEDQCSYSTVGAITGASPDTVNLPGGTYNPVGYNASSGWPVPFQSDGSGSYYYAGLQSNIAISLASSGSYTKPSQFTVSAKIWPYSYPGSDAGSNRGLALGFFSTSGTGAGTQYSSNCFTGLVLDSAGNLDLEQDPNLTGFFGAGSYTGTKVAYGGTWSDTAYHTLTYTVNTATGGISNISLKNFDGNLRQRRLQQL